MTGNKSSQDQFDQLRESLASVATLPGVYCMYDGDGKIIYVGKAKSLRKRIQSYFRTNLSSTKTAAMMKQVCSLETTVTHNETEALLLEQNLIKEHRPRFNILLRDDKSYPFLFLSNHKDYPYLAFKRSNKAGKGRLFGPYSNSYAVKSTLNLLQKVFRLRQCSDAFFSNRSRPCLQYQIGRCSAPCVGLISVEAYQQDVEFALLSIKGKNDQVVNLLETTMSQQAAALDYEQAAATRDKIVTLRKIQQHQAVTQQSGDADLLAIEMIGSGCCLHQMLVRSGKVIGSFNHFPTIRLETEPEQVIEQYIVQHYLLNEAITNYPQMIITSVLLTNAEMLEHMLTKQTGIRIKITANVRSERASWLRLAKTNAEQALQTRVNNKRSHHGRLQQLAQALNLEQLPQRIECYDISHTFGEATYASCVVFDQMGPKKNSYRLYSIKTTSKGDDYAAMSEVMARRFKNLSAEEYPDLLCIDGGKGQLSSALEQLEQLGALGLAVLGIAKGPKRKAGLEKLFFTSVGETTKPAEITLGHDSSALHLIQNIRDEAHRFAITNHRKQRAKKRKRSLLEDIPGVGPAKRQQLIHYFGGRQGVTEASPQDLEKVQGISPRLAQTIYQHLHDQSHT